MNEYIKLTSTKITFTYYVYNSIIDITVSNSEHEPVEVSFIDNENSKTDDMATIKFESLDELEFIIKDAKQKWNNIVKQFKLKV